jgi:hypothetical protein
MELRTEIEIDAPPQKVWDVLTNFTAFQEWNPFITEAGGELKEGARLSITIAPPEGSEQTFRPTVLRVEEPRELRWRGTLGYSWIFSGEHFFLLEAVDDGRRTRLVHGEDFGGLLVKFFGPTLTRTARGFVLMNQSLKRRTEGHK